MPFLLILGLLSLSFTAAAQSDADKLDPAAKARVPAEAQKKGEASAGATGIDARPAARTEQAEKEERRRSRHKQR